MRCEFPDLRRCCFCLPLRLGLLIAGYAEVILATFLIICSSLDVHNEIAYSHPLEYFGFQEITGLVFYIIGLSVTVGYLYGLHRKLILPVKVYYYYTITTSLVSLVLKMLEITQVMIAAPRALMFLILELLLVIIISLLEAYLLVSIHSFLKKLATEAGPHQYENTLEKIIYVAETPRNGDLNQQDTTHYTV